jgi:SNF2 family DNA or RNA helicase
VFVYTYICLETVEERIDQILATKRELFAAVVDESDLPKTLTAREILGLVGLDDQATLGAIARPSAW